MNGCALPPLDCAIPPVDPSKCRIAGPPASGLKKGRVSGRLFRRIEWLTACPALSRQRPAAGRAFSPLGDSSTVEQRTLTPLILVRIQVPQPANSLISFVSHGSRLRRECPDISVGYEARLAATATQRRKMAAFDALTAGMSLRPVLRPSVVQLRWWFQVPVRVRKSQERAFVLPSRGADPLTGR